MRSFSGVRYNMEFKKGEGTTTDTRLAEILKHKKGIEVHEVKGGTQKPPAQVPQNPPDGTQKPPAGDGNK